MHQSVLLNEAINALIIDPKGCYIDATFGRGGHSLAILEKLQSPGKLLVIDKDPDAINVAKDLQNQGLPIVPIQGSFAHLQQYVAQHQLTEQISGILMDLGVSSPQLDIAARGFSFMREGPLDMRMDPTQGESAAKWLQSVKEKELADILKTFGEERMAKIIAKAICEARNIEPIMTTTQLATIIKQAVPYYEKHKHPATRTFQAIRIFINHELDDLTQGLNAALTVLKPGGRLVVISFHSLEDRIVKQWMRKQEKGETLPIYLPIMAKDIHSHFKIIANITPSETEIEQNPRARSARMRVGEKT
ncbi:MAG: 16S rRNA (cytosine(1402)-N(4))-methyltransferase RsmH [Gammaproteobacteria bacterium]|jgi:16S rRNA (cytosine1402-N4)-methyltransferase